MIFKLLSIFILKETQLLVELRKQNKEIFLLENLKSGFKIKMLCFDYKILIS
jgi:hypothetical protein